jgi:hypothetical protein
MITTLLPADAPRLSVYHFYTLLTIRSDGEVRFRPAQSWLSLLAGGLILRPLAAEVCPRLIPW